VHHFKTGISTCCAVLKYRLTTSQLDTIIPVASVANLLLYPCSIVCTFQLSMFTIHSYWPDKTGSLLVHFMFVLSMLYLVIMKFLDQFYS